MLPDHDLIRDLAVDAGLDLCQALLFPNRQIVALIDAARRKDLRQKPDQHRLPLLHAETGDLKRQAAGKFIHRQPRQAVRFTKDHAARIPEAQRLPRLPRGLDAAAEKGAVDHLLLVTRQNADGQPGSGIKKTAGGKALPAVQHVDDAAVGADIVRPVQLVIIDQFLPRAHAGFLAAAQADLGIFHRRSGFLSERPCPMDRAGFNKLMRTGSPWDTAGTSAGCRRCRPRRGT